MAPPSQSTHSGNAEHKNPLKKPLLKKIQARSRHITREESKIKETWVYISTCIAVMGPTSLGFQVGSFFSCLLLDRIASLVDSLVTPHTF